MHARLMAGERLTQGEAATFMRDVMAGNVSSVRLAAALAALRVRGETPEEIAGFAQVMREHAVRVDVHHDGPLLDTCGTGGDGAHTFNISTTAAFVAAAGGARVAKHGNRAASSRAGSADVLEALGVDLDAPPARVAEAVENLGIGFMFARNYHPALRYAAPIRAELASRTVFNLLGPLSNPAGATHQVMGVFHPAYTRTLAEVLRLLGSDAAMVVHGAGLDELTVCGPTTITELRGGHVHDVTLTPEEAGVRTHDRAALAGGDAAENAAITRDVLQGRGTPAQQDVVTLNAGAALYVAGLCPSLPAGVERARDVLRSGEAWTLLERYSAFTRA
ncbi:anthranilate phosphoribosyltransferase [Deinococcus maricopensis]|uniref:Anthranilate phosphoribosyltransferase n=1 Tax=Deinococcus maricopensis (strain DSM 21211 / LMG 22137 / NRRL B-23946 / LB-34) TaxID=709986 RepID=E8U9U7_DEIML|nr:anthranilate phosphoribosyltransferase [Deinococcus maricopensis]ADV67836.1 Anthranilate phosphoribosyltransferase [Deinococcus maricopensis DSM 21211]